MMSPDLPFWDFYAWKARRLERILSATRLGAKEKCGLGSVSTRLRDTSAGGADEPVREREAVA
jgi:hypothetical protein